MKSYVFSILITLACFGGTIYAQDKCAIRAWVEDKVLIKDIFDHAEPSTTSKNIGEIPFVMEDGEETIVDIIGYKNGWVEITRASSIEDLTVFEGRGWIPASRVTANVQRPDGNSRKAAPLYSQADSSSKRAGTIPSETLIRIVGHSCFGLKVKYKSKTGWLPKKYICGNPVTTCS